MCKRVDFVVCSYSWRDEDRVGGEDTASKRYFCQKDAHKTSGQPLSNRLSIVLYKESNQSLIIQMQSGRSRQRTEGRRTETEAKRNSINRPDDLRLT